VNEAVLDIAISEIAPIESIVRLLKEFTKVFPDTQINLHYEHLRLPFERVQEESAAFAISPSFSGIDAMERCPWTVVEMIPVAAPDFPARNLGRSLSWAEMCHYTQVVVMDPPSVKEESSASLVEGAKRWRVSDFSTIKEIISAGLGWAFMPKHLVASELKRGKLARLEIDRGGDEVPLNLIRKTTRPLGPAGQYAWELLRKAQQKKSRE
jgi:DNA-binding transcriptional LysR family regulator